MTGAPAERTDSADIAAARRIGTLVLALAFGVGIVHRLAYGWEGPFWLDEAYSGTIAAQSTFAGLLDWCRHELSGPLYYMLLWLWEKLAGSGDTALRLPSLACAFAAPCVILANRDRPWRERLVWAALVATWIPGLRFASQARPQALLFLLATLQAVWFLRAMTTAARRDVLVWSALTAAAVLTHLYSAASSGLQGLAIVALLGSRGQPIFVRALPAFAPFVVPAIWLPQQLPFIRPMLRPGVAASYPLIQTKDLVRLPLDLVGTGALSYGLLALVAVALAVMVARRLRHDPATCWTVPELALTVSGFVPLVAVVVMATITPSYALHYTIPFFPAILFGVALVLLRGSGSRFELPLLPLLVVSAGACGGDLVRALDPRMQAMLQPYEFEQGSAWLAARGTTRVVLIWDNPGARLNAPRLQSEMAGFFFRRAGLPVWSQALPPPAADADLAAELPRLMRANRAALLWIDGANPAPVDRLEGMDCVRFGGRNSHAMACDFAKR